jgi:hypothetical protein
MKLKGDRKRKKRERERERERESYTGPWQKCAVIRGQF